MINVCRIVVLRKGYLPIRIAEELKTALLKYREATGLGRGIAAPQIGSSKRVFITYVGDKFQMYINPKIERYSEETNKFRELCMSSGVMWGDIERPENIIMTWTDENGGLHESQKFESFEARLLQHEYDHVEGMVTLDKTIPGTNSFVRDNPAEEKLR